MTRIKTQLRLMGTILPEHITQQLKTKPDESWTPGEGQNNNFGWALDSGWEESLDLGAQAQKTLDRLNYRIGILQQWATTNRQQLNLELACCVEISGSTPSINFSPQLLQRVASLGASIDVDVYRV